MKRIFFFLIVTWVLNSCTNQDERPLILEKIEAGDGSIFGNWKLVDWFDEVPRDINGDGQESMDLFSQWNGCGKHTILVLRRDYSGRRIYIGPNDNPKCPPGTRTNHSSPTLPWKLDENMQRLTFIGSDFFDSYEIVELTTETLILEGAGFLSCCDEDISYFTGGYLRFERL